MTGRPAAGRGQSLSSRFGRVAVDLLMAGSFFIAWARGASDGLFSIQAMELVLIVEFLSIHASGLFLVVILRPSMKAQVQSLVLFVAGASYAIFFITMGLNYGVWWPTIAFGVLVADKIALVGQIARARQDRAPNLRKFAAFEWALRFLLFGFAAVLSITLPWPGVYESVATLEGADKGVRILGGHVLLIHGALYFALCAIVRYRAVPAMRRQLGL